MEQLENKTFEEKPVMTEAELTLTESTREEPLKEKDTTEIKLPRFSVYFGFGHISIIDRKNQ